MSPVPLARGLLATLLALLQLLSWYALGSFFLRRVRRIDSSLLTRILLGSAIVSFLYAVFSWSGWVTLGLSIVSLVELTALLLKYKDVRRMLRYIRALFARFARTRKWSFRLLSVTVVFYWLISIGPPRDADVLRYHLTHVRQIDLDRGWQPIADYHYAMPFGWSLTYLPFQHLHFPEAAGLLSFLLWIVAIALVYGALRSSTDLTMLTVFAVFVFPPQVMKAVTSAHADAYVMALLLALTLLLRRLPNLRPVEFALLGFTAWAGMQSRYQAIAFGLAGTALIGILLIRKRISAGDARAFLGGAVLAYVLALPFYLFNWFAFQNPVWPLLAGRFTGKHSYADALAARFTSDTGTTLSLRAVSNSIAHLVVKPEVFPVPLLALALPIAFLVWRPAKTRYVTAFLALFLAVWMLAEPGLYYRFGIWLAPVVAIGFAPILDRWQLHRQVTRVLLTGGCLLITAFLSFNLLYGIHYLRYDLNGDLAAYHRYTWFYEPYRWADLHTPPSSKFLVMVTFGETYYLDRAYRRADPWASPYVDWTAIRKGRDLDNLMQAGGFDYVLYEDKDWSRWSGGQQMTDSLRAAQSEGFLKKAAAFHVTLNSVDVLSSLRMRPAPSPSTVWILERTARAPRSQQQKTAAEVSQLGEEK
ncbi:MAG: hypothetical protein JWP08_2480 [Bryobacterales bacterium]|nr:hypothetical protein [Bryobacterales bacterium]